MTAPKQKLLKAGANTRVKQDADYIFHELTRSICPECKQVIDAQIIIRENKVYMRKRCPDHGWFEGIISSDAGMYVDSVKFNKPGTIPLEFSTEVKDGCPLDCGLCPEHKQHMCLGLIEVNTACNLNCPVCFANAGIGFSLTLEQVESMLDRFVEIEGDPEVIQFSGGEPTIHPQLLDMIQAAQDRGIRQVMVNTNGVRIARDDRFLEQLARLNPVIYFQFDGLRPETYMTIRGEDLLETKLKALDRLHEAGLDAVIVAAIERDVNVDEVGALVEFGLEHPAVRGAVFQAKFLEQLARLNPVIYFQFDGLRPETYMTIRGEDLLETKLKALDRLHEAGLDAVIVAAIERDVNVDEVGALVEFGLEHPAVRGAVFQPVTHVGRHIPFDPMQRVTIPDVIHGIVDQTGGKFVLEDFVPVPCCFPTCQVNSYVFVDGQKIVPLPRMLEIDQYLDYITNRALPKAPGAALIKQALEGLWSASAVAGTEKTADQFQCACGPGLELGYELSHLKDHIFQIAIKDFMDAYTFNVKQVMKCCVGILVPDGRIIPFCAYNSVGYRETIREEMVQAQAANKKG